MIALLLIVTLASADAGVAEVKRDQPMREEPKPERPAPPPALSQSALAAELKKTAKEHKAARAKLDEERKAIEAERAKLEALKKEIDDARAALRVETERLEGIIPNGAPAAARPAASPAVKAGPAASGQVKSLAKTLKGMKPEHAAVVIAKLDRTLAAQLLREMKPADAGAVLEKLKPDVAADLVSLLATAPPPQKDLL